MTNNLADSIILIVDDSEQNVRLLAHILKSKNYEVNAAFSGKDALTMVGKRKPDLILLDIMMPEMNGFEVCEELKRNSETKDIPVIFLSALSESESKARSMEAGGADYLTKPFNRNEILERIELHLQQARREIKMGC